MSEMIMKLRDAPFNAIKQGTKKIEIRLNDEKRKKLKIGDTILFEGISGNILRVKVIKLEQFPSFATVTCPLKDLSSTHFDNKEQWIKSMYAIYSKEEEAKYGVLAIHLKIF